MIPDFTSDCFLRIAEEFKLHVWVEPSWRTVGFIELANGTRRYWTGSTLDLNLAGAAELSKDKGYTSEILREAGLPTPIGKTFASDEWCFAIGSKDNTDAALAYAKIIGYPLIVKPNSSQGGRAVFRVENDEDLHTALRNVFTEHKLARVETFCTGKDARLVILDGEVVIAYERSPLSIVGDGIRSILELMIEREVELRKRGRIVRINEEEPRIAFHVSQIGIQGTHTVLEKGAELVLLPSANLSTGGSVRSIRTVLHNSYKELALHAAKLLNLRYCGIDIISSGAWSNEVDSQTVVLEINGKQPGVTQYAHEGEKERMEVEELYHKLFRAIIEEK